MTERKPRIVFMGTPEFAVASLKALHESGCDIAAVVTVPDKPAGRGRKLTFSPVKEYALENRLTLLQPEKLRDPEFIAKLKDLNADIFAVVAFRMLPEAIWNIPPAGTFNLHASLLPQYRGAAPINHAVINGETRTGVTTFLIDKEIDTGMILLSRETAITPDDTAGSLHDRLMLIGAALTVETAEGLLAGSLKPVPQTSFTGEHLKPAPKIFPADTVIDWGKPAEQVHNLIRGLSPYPGATAMLKKDGNLIRLKILGSSLGNDTAAAEPGKLTVTEKSRLTVSCGEGCVEITSLIPEGRKRMSAAEFLRGFDPEGWELA
ncbi:MAG: methionyl-tRNA formyltransferase [Bacteroidota bacterium]|jgi:methionyl-tRNA formyltransferase|nr:methionyl-tRNA formyltransferase [Bacteroidota bacterium]